MEGPHVVQFETPHVLLFGSIRFPSNPAVCSSDSCPEWPSFRPKEHRLSAAWRLRFQWLDFYRLFGHVVKTGISNYAYSTGYPANTHLPKPQPPLAEGPQSARFGRLACASCQPAISGARLTCAKPRGAVPVTQKRRASRTGFGHELRVLSN